MNNKFIKARRMDLISKLIKEEDSEFTSKINSILPEDSKLAKLTSDLILIKKENGFDVGFSKDTFSKIGGNPVNLESLFDPLISSYVPKMKEDIISLLAWKRKRILELSSLILIQKSLLLLIRFRN